MKTRRRYKNGMRAAAVGAVAFLMAWCGSALAQGFHVTITVDENCDGTLTNTNGLFRALPCSVQPSAPPAMTYLLGAPALTDGFVALDESAGDTLFSDIIEFTGTSPTNFALLFFSDTSGGVDALADTGLPAPPPAGVLTLLEIGPEGNNGVTYSPVAGQPGFINAFNPITYVIHSDSAPEPATLALLALGLAGLGFARRKLN